MARITEKELKDLAAQELRISDLFKMSKIPSVGSFAFKPFFNLTPTFPPIDAEMPVKATEGGKESVLKADQMWEPVQTVINGPFANMIRSPRPSFDFDPKVDETSWSVKVTKVPAIRTEQGYFTFGPSNQVLADWAKICTEYEAFRKMFNPPTNAELINRLQSLERYNEKGEGGEREGGTYKEGDEV